MDRTPRKLTTAPPAGCLWIEGAAEYLGYEVSTLRKWRQEKRGPAAFRIGGRVAYRKTALDTWLKEQKALEGTAPNSLSVDEAAAYLGIAVSTLYKWRQRGEGPDSVKRGGRIAYRKTALDAWLAEQEASDPHSNPDLDPANAPVEARAAA